MDDTALPNENPVLIRCTGEYQYEDSSVITRSLNAVAWPTGTIMYRTLPNWGRIPSPIFIPTPMQITANPPIPVHGTDYTWDTLDTYN